MCERPWRRMVGQRERKRLFLNIVVNSQGQCDIQKITEKAFNITIKLQNMFILIS